jgi:peptidoglycan/xylan/chitin deacetylase (PgdA/CDA1 family)
MSLVLEADTSPRRWRPSPLVMASMGLHCLAGLGALARPEAWPLATGAIAANHALLTTLGMWPRSSWLGPNLVRLPEASRARGEIALTFDDGPDPEVTPAVLDLLDERAVSASFFCIGDRARANPDVCREIARRGHTVENHSCGHPVSFAFLSMGGFRREIGRAQSTLAELAGSAPAFFRPPAGLRNPLLDPALHGLGLRLATWTRRGFDTRNRDPSNVAARLTTRMGAGDILLLHDGHSARAATGRPVVLEALPRVLDAAARAGLSPVTLRQAMHP